MRRPCQTLLPSLESSRPSGGGGLRSKGKGPAPSFDGARHESTCPAEPTLMNRWTRTKPSASKGTDAALKHDTPAGPGTPGAGLRRAGLASSWRHRSPLSAHPPRTLGAPQAPSCPGGSTEHVAPSSKGRGAWRQRPRLSRGAPGTQRPQRAAVGRGCIHPLLEPRRLQQAGAHGEFWGAAACLRPAGMSPANQQVGCRLASFRLWGNLSVPQEEEGERECPPPQGPPRQQNQKRCHAGRCGHAGTRCPRPRTAACPSEHRLCLNVCLLPGREH